MRRVFTALCIILAAAITCGALAYASGWAVVRLPLAAGKSATTQGGQGVPVNNAERDGSSSERLEVEGITFGWTGFNPPQITRPAGRFVIAIANRGGGRDVQFRLDAERGGRLREVRLPPRKNKWSEAVELPPGRYLLTEANRPESKCLIIITPKGN